MRILSRVPGSVLWLPEANPTARNLLATAVRCGVSADRLIFAKRLPEMADHLARLRLADLFLDTWPYNAHATACDALWAGLPVLTCPGQAFAARVAASLLNRHRLAGADCRKPGRLRNSSRGTGQSSGRVEPYQDLFGAKPPDRPAVRY